MLTAQDMPTFTLKPFAAPLGESLASGLERVEFSAGRWLPLNLLYCRARRQQVR